MQSTIAALREMGGVGAGWDVQCELFTVGRCCHPALGDCLAKIFFAEFFSLCSEYKDALPFFFFYSFSFTLETEVKQEPGRKRSQPYAAPLS